MRGEAYSLTPSLAIEVQRTYHSHNNGQTNRTDSKNLVPVQLGPSRRPNNGNRLFAPGGGIKCGVSSHDHGGIFKGIPAFIGVPVLDLVQFRRGAAFRGAVEQVRSKAKATAGLGDASIVERAVGDATTGTGRQRTEVHRWGIWTHCAEPVFYIHPASPIAAPGADKRYRGLAEAFDCVGITVGSE
jgi:hypothetical protein